MRMDRLDKLVIEGLADDLLEPERLSAMLSSLDQRRAEKAAAVGRRLAALAHEPKRRTSGCDASTSSWRTAAAKWTTF